MTEIPKDIVIGAVDALENGDTINERDDLGVYLRASSSRKEFMNDINEELEKRDLPNATCTGEHNLEEGTMYKVYLNIDNDKTEE